MSNDESAMAAGSSIRFKTCVGAALSSLALRPHTTWSVSTAGCPSGQWKRTVNPWAYAFAGSNPAPASRQSGNRRQATLVAGHLGPRRLAGPDKPARDGGGDLRGGRADGGDVGGVAVGVVDAGPLEQTAEVRQLVGEPGDRV